VRWVDVNKGTDEAPRIRSRLVGQEFARGERRDELYAPTPSLAAARLAISMVVSQSKQGPKGWEIVLLDIKKAFLYGKMWRNVYIELPDEDEKSGRGLVGKLDRAMYGTRDAPAEWQAELERTMVSIGFVQSSSTPCVYYHEDWQLRVVAHVDDLLCVGPGRWLKHFLKELDKFYDCTATTLGPERADSRGARSWAVR